MVVRISSSIFNFREKILVRYNLSEWKWWKDLWEPTIFWGCYHIGDYLRVLLHRGKRTIWWCGSDILHLKRNTWQYGGIWRWFIRRVKAKHVCENDVEKVLLREMGIEALVQAIILDNPDKFNVCFKRSNTPQVYLCAHPGYEETYGVSLIEGIASVVPDVGFHIYGVDGESHDNVKFHGKVSNERFNEEIRGYQAGLRLNSMDGVSEVMSKSCLMGQWPITMHIAYPFVTYANDLQALIGALNDLKNKKEPNYKAAEYWRHELNKPLI